MRQIRNVIRYLVVVMVNIFIMYVFHSYLNLLLLIGLLLLPFYSIYGVYRVKRELSLELVLPKESMEKESEFHLGFILHNPTWFPLVNATIKLTIANRFYEEERVHYLNIPVRARRDTETVYLIMMEYCGRLSVKMEEIKLLDLLGIYEAVIPIQEEQECLIFPKGELRTQEAGQIYINGVSEAMESREKGYDFSEISGIREYIPGDKLQNIHWKLSMKKDELMVKERISVSAMQLNVLVELANDEEMRLEGVLELAAGITKSFVAQNLPFTVYYYSTNLGTLKECFIGNRMEWEQWMEMLLYDRTYADTGRVEQMFLKENVSAGSYLYIGHGVAVTEESAIFGEKDSIAVLKR